MGGVEERVAHLEGQMNELSQLKGAIFHLEQRFDARFEGVDRKFESVDRRFEGIDRRFDAVDRRFDTLDRRIDALDNKVSHQFMWLVGIQVTTLVAIVVALISRG